jgi:glycosyltransferase involved in cell wall biosynthesis
MSAYACEPEKGSEPGAGWAWTRAAALSNEVWVLTRENNRESIEAALKAESSLDLHPVYLDLPRWAGWWKKGHRGARLYYVLWQAVARRRAKSLHAEHRFDVAHHITFAVDSLPAGVVGISGLPAIWGPVGGASPFLWPLVRWLGWRGFVKEASRSAVTGVTRRFFGDRNAKRAVLVIAQNDEVARRFSSARVIVEPNVALDLAQFPTKQDRSQQGGVSKRLVFVGRLIPLKGLLIAVAVLAEPEAADWRLVVVGDGPERRRADKLVRRLGLGQRVEFLGQVPRAQVFSELRDADAMLFPSMHDSAPWSVGEALAVGVPVLALDVCGPPVIIERTHGGVVVSPKSRTIAADFARKIDAVSQLRSRSFDLRSLELDRLGPLVNSWYLRAVVK